MSELDDAPTGPTVSPVTAHAVRNAGRILSHDCDEIHGGLCSVCCRIVGPCGHCQPCSECRESLGHMWRILDAVDDQAWAEDERRGLLALSRMVHR